MGEEQPDFRISFRGLLSDVTKALGWPEPIYSQADFTMNRANVVLVRSPSPNACFFRGDAGRDLAESEEQAAEQAIDFLVQKNQIIVADVSLERRLMYKACCKFYKEKREVLETYDQKLTRPKAYSRKKKTTTVHNGLPKTVTVDLSAVWSQVVQAYSFDVDDLEYIREPGGRHVCCFTITWAKPSPMERYFIGDCCETLEEAKRSLDRKALTYFQTLYGFSVKDANFNRMRFSKMQCAFQRTGYMAARARHVCMVSDLESAPLFQGDGYQTPEGPSDAITSGLSLPPPPKKHRAVSNDKASSAETQKARYTINNNKFEMFGRKLQGREPSCHA